MMKKMKMMVFIICMFSASLTAPPNHRGTVVQGEAIRPYEAAWQAVCKVESNNNPFAVGDKHLEEYSYGISQIRRVKLDWYYNRTGIRHSLQDCFDVEISKSIFLYHMMQYASIDDGIKAWNGSGRKAEQYLKKVKSIIQ